jgi:hypothetical protein
VEQILGIVARLRGEVEPLAAQPSVNTPVDHVTQPAPVAALAS